MNFELLNEIAALSKRLDALELDIELTHQENLRRLGELEQRLLARLVERVW